MKVFHDIESLAKELGVTYMYIEDAYDKWIGHGYMFIGDTEIKVHIKDDNFHYVIVDEGDDNDIKEYFMTYMLEKYIWKVYVDDIEKWQECKVIDIQIEETEITRATVVIKTGTQLNRIAKYVLDEEDEDFKADGCVYYMDNIK